MRAAPTLVRSSMTGRPLAILDDLNSYARGAMGCVRGPSLTKYPCPQVVLTCPFHDDRERAATGHASLHDLYRRAGMPGVRRIADAVNEGDFAVCNPPTASSDPPVGAGREGVDIACLIRCGATGATVSWPGSLPTAPALARRPGFAIRRPFGPGS